MSLLSLRAPVTLPKPRLYPEEPEAGLPYRARVAGLTPLQHVAVRYLAGGWPVTRVASELKIPGTHIRKWMNTDQAFRTAFQEQIVAHVELVETILLEGERRAAETLVAALEAKTPKGEPNWQARVQAATNLLDREGRRGKAVERQQVAQVTTHLNGTQANVEDALRKALRDPGVRMWLKDSGAIVGLLSGDSSAPSTPEDAEIVINDGFEGDAPGPNPIDTILEEAD